MLEHGWIQDALDERSEKDLQSSDFEMTRREVEMIIRSPRCNIDTKIWMPLGHVNNEPKRWMLGHEMVHWGTSIGKRW